MHACSTQIKPHSFALSAFMWYLLSQHPFNYLEHLTVRSGLGAWLLVWVGGKLGSISKAVFHVDSRGAIHFFSKSKLKAQLHHLMPFSPPFVLHPCWGQGAPPRPPDTDLVHTLAQATSHSSIVEISGHKPQLFGAFLFVNATFPA